MMGAPKNSAAPVIRYSGLRVSTSQMDAAVPIFGGQRRLTTNAIDYVNFKATKAGSKKGGGGKKGGSVQYSYSASVVLAMGAGIIDSVIRVFAAGQTNTTTTLAALGATFFTGSSAQTPWSYLTTNFPSHALNYKNIAYIGIPNMALGYTPSIPDNHFECQRTSIYPYSHSTPGWIDPATNTQDTAKDILLADWLYDLLTNSVYGFGFTSGDFANIADFATYNRAQGIFVSPLMVSQEKMTSAIDRYAQIGHTWIFSDGVQIRCVPLGDTAITANGVTYTPNTTVDATFGPDDFIGDPPLTVSRKDPADCYNRTRLTITDRTIGYVSNPFEYKDQTLVDTFGLRDASSVQADEICDPLVAQVVVQLIGKRVANIRGSYKWQASYRFLALLPGSIVTLTEPNLGLTGFPVRITDIDGNEDGTLAFTAEEYTGTVSSFVASNPSAATVSSVPNLYAVPDSVNTPAIVEPDSAFTGGVPVLLIAGSGTNNWGGAIVNVSFDGGTTYENIGQITSPATQGLLTGTLADHADPDTTNTLHVDTTESGLAIGTASHADADANRTLTLIAAQPVAGVMPVNGELLSYGAVSATSTFGADLTYLRRAQYGSAHSSHATGQQFSEIDVLGVSGTTLRYQLPSQYIGAALTFKFQSYNQFGNSLQDISTSTAYTYTPTGLGYGTASGGKPATPTGLTATGGIQSAAVSWSANPAADNVTEYNLYRAPGTGAAFGSASLVATISALNKTDTGLAANTGYTYFLTAVNAVGEGGHSAGVNATTLATLVGFAGAAFSCQDISTKPLNSTLNGFDSPYAWTLPSVAHGGFVAGYVDNAPASDTTFGLLKNGIQVATVTWAAGSNTATLTNAADVAMAIGDRLDPKTPASLNGMSGIWRLTVPGTR